MTISERVSNNPFINFYFPMNQLKIALISILFFSCVAFCQHSVIVNGSDIYMVPKGPHTETLVYLHGLGGTGKNTMDHLFNNDNLMFARPTTKIVLLTAPVRPVTYHGGQQMHAWFNIFTNKIQTEADFPVAFNMTEFLISSARIKQAMRDEIKLLGGDSTKVFIGGMSQGCMMAIYTGLAFEQPLGGIMASSGVLVVVPEAPFSGGNVNTPIWISHGKADTTVPFEAANMIYTDRLSPLAHKITKVYEDGVGHVITSTMQANGRKWFFDLTTPKTEEKRFLPFSF